MTIRIESLARARLALLVLLYSAPMFAAGAQVAADTSVVRCRVERSSDDTHIGHCTRNARTIGDVRIRPDARTPHLWVGTIADSRLRPGASGAPAGASEIGVDIRPGGAIRIGRAWLAAEGVAHSGATLEFSFRLDNPAPANATDVGILRRARAMLAAEEQWHRSDSTDMAAAPVKGFTCAPAPRQSLFCALYLATLDVAGEYFHFRPAINAVRHAVSAASTRSYRHPLVDFNNDSARTLADIHAVYDSALAAIERETAGSSVITLYFPDTVANFIRRSRRDFEDPAAGVGHRYEHPSSSLFADIYVYPGPDLATRCPVACARDYLAREVADFEAYVPGRMTQGRFAQAARVAASEALTPHNGARWQLGHHVAAAITRDGRELRSEFYLFYLPGYRVKFRSTFVDTPARNEALDAFVKAVLAGLPMGDDAEP